MADNSTSYRQILCATSLIGAASAINILFQIVRVKVLAVLLGPTGIGLLGMYQSILGTASGLAGLGIGFSAVRQIAEARTAGDPDRIGEVVYVLRVLTISLGAIGAVALFVLRAPIAEWTFGDLSKADYVGWLGIAVFVGVASQSLGALLQGFRRIGDQARLQVWGAALSTVIAIGAILAFEQDGVVLFVVAMPLANALLAWRYARRIGVTTLPVALRKLRPEAQRMISLGVMVMAAGAIGGILHLVLRSRITQELSIEATGLFQAAWSLSFIYMGFVLDAMSKDYYPHLTEHSSDRKKATQLMREQINVAVVLLGPLIVASIGFAPLLVELLYASTFRDAVPVIQWMGLGNLLKLVSWPLGFIVLAQGRSRLYFVLEMIWYATFVGLSWVLLDSLGLIAIGVAFTVAYALHLMVLYLVGHSLTAFQFDQTNWVTLLIYGGIATAIFIVANVNAILGYGVAGLSLAVASWYSYTRLAVMVGQNPFDLAMAKLRVKRTSK